MPEALIHTILAIKLSFQDSNATDASIETFQTINLLSQRAEYPRILSNVSWCFMCRLVDPIMDEKNGEWMLLKRFHYRYSRISRIFVNYLINLLLI